MIQSEVYLELLFFCKWKEKFRVKYNTIQEAFARSVEKNKKKVAIEYKGREFTYSQIDNLSNILATHLQNQGVKQGDKLGLFIEDRLVLVVTILAILKIRAIFVPMDIKFPKKRLLNMLKISSINIVFSDVLNIENIIEASAFYKLLKFDKDIFKRKDTYVLDERYDPEDPIYVYFTSGTTGDAKAVLGKNISLLHFILWENEFLDSRIEKRVSQFTMPTHDPYLRDVFLPLLTGGICCIPDKTEMIFDPLKLKKWINETKISIVHMTPSMMKILNASNYETDDFQTLKYVFLAGEKLLSSHIEKWYKLYKKRIQIVNLYGPTETTLAVCYHQIIEQDISKEIIPIGKPISDIDVYILDNNLEECDLGVEGQIGIVTEYAALGYYGDINGMSNFHKIDNKKILYLTGDYGIKDDNDNIVFLRRKDKEVKIRGYRINLDEIENLLMRYPGIINVAIKLGESLFDIYIVSRFKILESSVKKYLKENLPDYMMPRNIYQVEDIPLNENRKIDYNKLQFAKETKKITNENKISERIVEIWCEILERDTVGLNEAFMDIGGDSLSIMLLIAKTQSEFNVELSIWDIFDGLTVNKMETLITDNQN